LGFVAMALARTTGVAVSDMAAALDAMARAGIVVPSRPSG
jgi:hypothetical protein